MSPLLRKKRVASKRRHSAVLVDIGSGSVGAALIESNAGAKPTILALKRIALKITAERNTPDLEGRIARALREALEALAMDMRRHRARRVVIFLPAPWSTLSLSRVRFSQDRLFLADAKLLKRLVQDHLERAEASDKSSVDAVFERDVAGVRLNGYVSPALPASAEVFRVELMLAAASATRSLISALQEIVHQRIAAADLTFHSTALAAAHTLCSINPSTPSFLLCDGEGELAELVVVKETIPEAHATIPVGHATFMRTLIAHSGLSHGEIRSALALLADPRSPLGAHAEEALAAAQTVCSDALGAAGPLCALYAPRTCYLLGDGPEAEWFAAALEHSPRLRSMMPHDFEVRRVTSAMLDAHVIHAPEARRTPDVMLELEAMFVSDRLTVGQSKQFYLP